MAAQQVGHHRRAALVGDRRHVDAGLGAEDLARELLGAAAVTVKGAGLRLHVGHQLRQGAHGQIGMDQQQVGDFHGERDRHEVLQRVIADLAEEMRVDRQRAGIAHQQSVLVGRRLGREGRADIAASAGLVIDDEGLSQRRAHRSATVRAFRSALPPAGNAISMAARAPCRKDMAAAPAFRSRFSCRFARSPTDLDPPGSWNHRRSRTSVTDRWSARSSCSCRLRLRSDASSRSINSKPRICIATISDHDSTRGMGFPIKNNDTVPEFISAQSRVR